jgi:uncharacterized protein (DUF1800 family)
MDALDVEAVLALPPDQRFAKLVSFSPEEEREFQSALRGGQRLQMVQGFKPQQVEAVAAMQGPTRVVAAETLESRLVRDLYSQRQLQAVMTDFWLNHFNVYLRKNQNEPYLLPAYQRQTILPNALGNFEGLLRATAQSPAMLMYLDNWESIGPDSQAATRVRRVQQARPDGKIAQNLPKGINENYARELMELHTLGVDGGYTQKDVQEVARCFTGWTIAEPNRGGQFRFAPRTHDDGEKVVLGVTIPSGGGIKDGEKVLDILARHPSTARYIATRLAQRFVADNPPPSLIDHMATTFTRTDGDLKAVVRTMFESREFMSEGAYHAKIKSPLEMVAGALRATGATLSSAMSASQAIAQMGQPLYRKQEPTGYSNSGEDWLNSAGLLARMNFAIALSENKLPGVKIDKDRYAALARSTGAPEWQRR